MYFWRTQVNPQLSGYTCCLGTGLFFPGRPPGGTDTALSAVRPRWLPHGALHPAQHHHAGEAAHPEQPVRDRHPVSPTAAEAGQRALGLGARGGSCAGLGDKVRTGWGKVTPL